TYLPTYNQVEKTREEYEKNGFIHLETVEIEGRDMQVKKGATRPRSTGIIHTGFISTYLKVSGTLLKV
ncbi:MAG: protein methyltransferase, partial [Candidatus Thermoplasmatota archaeon]|nr:protein methyltransferase [Candidatus Thermoplasmatota archaeon]